MHFGNDLMFERFNVLLHKCFIIPPIILVPRLYYAPSADDQVQALNSLSKPCSLE